MRKFYLVVLILLSVSFYANSSNTVNNSNREKLTTTNVEKNNMEKLIKAIIRVESNGNIAAVSSDGECVGVLQIKKIVVDDCNEYLKMKGIDKKFTYNDRLSKEKSIEMFYLIQERYKNFKRFKSKSDIEHAIRLWNGGCNYSRDKTDLYFKKVMNEYNSIK